MPNTTYLNISLKNKEDIESAAQNLVTSIQSAIFKSSHPKIQSSKHNTRNQSLSINITNLISEKWCARSRWQKYHYPSDKKLYNHLANTIKKLTLKHKSKYFENKYQSLNQTDGSLWKTTKNLLRRKEHLSMNSPITDSNGSLAISDIEKVNLFGKHLLKIFTSHADIIPNSDHSETIKQFINSPLPMSLPAKHTSPSEILFLIKKLKDGKSPGHDLITNKILKNLPRKPILLITFIFNAMLRLSYFPLIWKLSTVILIPEPNKPKTLATSYRPISLLPTLAKLFEKIILKRIRPIMQTHKIIPNSQFGFRAKHSTVHQIHRLTDKISSSFEMKQFCPGVFLDVAQAFDRVWHDGLIYKLKLFLPAPYYLIIRSCLENRSYKIRYGSSYSPHFSKSRCAPRQRPFS
ncbi:Reverse transcriptase domain [Cinara cedri]|uniref:Reverse transcriptase domain n=1 Tax=Cinara cedri TaxID=506608 RepID=A0A5E4MDZ2_9HEMI|nr:Reverse transcriptase domain [Cinara cedri]